MGGVFHALLEWRNEQEDRLGFRYCCRIVVIRSVRNRLFFGVANAHGIYRIDGVDWHSAIVYRSGRLRPPNRLVAELGRTAEAT